MGALRLILAAATLLWHCPEGVIARYLHPALAVQCFYVISGFLIQMVIVSYRDKGGRRWYMPFYGSRLLRLLPIYWLICIVTLALFGNPVFTLFWTGGDLKGLFAFTFSNLLFLGQDLLRVLTYDIQSRHFALVPSSNISVAQLISANVLYGGQLAIVTQSWTLAVEMLFYLSAPFLLLRRNAFVCGVILAGAAFRALMVRHGYMNNTYLYGVIFCEISVFLSGALAARFYRHWLAEKRLHDALARILPARIAAIALKLTGWLTLPLLVDYYFEGWHSYPQGGGYGQGLFAVPYAWWTVIAATALSLPWLMHSFGKLPWDRFLGDLSYPLYITHFLVLECVTKYVNPPQEWTCVYVFALSLAVSCVLVLLLERPVDRLRHRLFPRSKTIAPAPCQP